MYATIHVTADGENFHDAFDTYAEAEAYAHDVLEAAGGSVGIYTQLQTFWAEDAPVADLKREFQVRPGVDFPGTLNG